LLASLLAKQSGEARVAKKSKACFIASGEAKQTSGLLAYLGYA
jgi:hypothetical protein